MSYHKGMLESIKNRITAAKKRLGQVNWAKIIQNFCDCCRWFNIELTTAFGITTTIHWSVPLALFCLTVISPWSAGILCMTLLSIVPHEYGHALVARHYKIKTRRIIIYPIGGIAFLESGLIKVEKWRELFIAIAGPAVSFLMSLIGLAFFILKGPTWERTPDVAVLAYHPTGFWFYVFIINATLAIFNLLPAFPMDGGRILRGILTFWMNYVTATQICVHLSTCIAVMLAFLGLLYGNFAIIITMLFIIFLGRGELQVAQRKQYLEQTQKLDKN